MHVRSKPEKNMSLVRSLGILTAAAVLVAQSVLSQAASPVPVAAPPRTADYNSVVWQLTIDDLREAMQGVWAHGLNPARYWTPELEAAFHNSGATSSLRPLINQKFIELLQDISIGSVNPEEMSDDIKLKRKAFVTPAQLQTLVVASGNNAVRLVEAMAPKNAPYLALVPGVKKLYAACANGSYGNLSMPRRTLRAGVSDAAVSGLKQRLAFWGYPMTINNTVDGQLVAAINDIEWNLHLQPDGNISPGGQVWKFINAPCRDRLRQVQADMEKMRWFTQRFEDRFIFVNLAMNYFAMFNSAENFLMTFRTINGRPTRKTPTMRDKVVRVILNPEWIVPPTVFLEDKVEEIKNLPHGNITPYFSEHNYEIWDTAFRQKFEPTSINWWAIQSKEDSNFYIRQRPNYLNALGVVKFELTNPYMIYLHDTNQRELFATPNRLVSSGCIRLEKPLDVAEYLLRGTSWDAAAIQNTISKPGEVKDKSTPIVLKNPMPVYLVFMTSQTSGDGILRFTEDLYGQNEQILSKMRGAF
jgi:murein L,D-transpeptidase YcbB/YkuD